MEPHFSPEQELVAKLDTVKEIAPVDKSVFSKPILTLISVVVGVVILAFAGFNYLVPKQTSQLTFDNLRPLTATDDKEYAAVYSPDGQYIVFHRYLDKVCMNNLWAKNVSTQQETRLTKDIGTYGSHSFSLDGKKLAFVSTEDCDKPIPQNSCYNLVSLDFRKALDSPQLSKLMVECKNSKLRDPVWIDNDNIAVMQKKQIVGNSSVIRLVRTKALSYSKSQMAI